MLKEAAKMLKKHFLGSEIKNRGKINVENLKVDGDVITARCGGFHRLPPLDTAV